MILMDTQATLTQFDAYLATCNLTFEAVVIGGAALNLLGLITRQTRDCDVLHPDVPDEILRAARTFAADQRSLSEQLQDDWFNAGPGSLVDTLPDDWPAHVRETIDDLRRQLHHGS